MNKTVLAVLVLLSTVSLIGFAGATRETTQGVGSFGGEPAYPEQRITLTGTLDLRQPYAFPVLKTDSGRWVLMVGRMHGFESPVRDGDTVTVTGFEAIQGYGEEGMRAFVVTQALIGGRKYRLSGRSGGHWMVGPFGMTGYRKDGRLDSCSRWGDLL